MRMLSDADVCSVSVFVFVYLYLFMLMNDGRPPANYIMNLQVNISEGKLTQSNGLIAKVKSA